MLRADVLFVGFLCFASPDFSRVSSLFAKKLAVFAKSLRSSTACSTLLELADFSTISMRRLISSRSSITQGPLGAVYGLQNLLSTPANAARLRSSIAELDAAGGQERELEE